MKSNKTVLLGGAHNEWNELLRNFVVLMLSAMFIAGCGSFLGGWASIAYTGHIASAPRLNITVQQNGKQTDMGDGWCVG
jgi:hypothetical protein